jgi:hypothetical protein
MVDYVLNTVDLDVFGGPTSLDVSTDFGKTGDRGTRVWVGNGDPANVLTTQDIALYDLYINTNTVDQFYSWLYQYVPEVGNPTWVRTLRLNPQQNSRISLITFEDGSATLDIPTSIITTDTTLTADKFTIRYNFENGTYSPNTGNPVASSFNYGIETILGAKYLRIIFKGAEWNGTEWNDLSGSYKVHTFISYLSN